MPSLWISEKTGLNQSQVFDVVQKTLDYITETLADAGKVEIRNFGVFEVKIRKARVGRNPNRPESTCLPQNWQTAARLVITSR